MFDVDKFLDRAKAAARVDTDYKLAVKVLGYAQQSTVTNWRSGRSVPDERAILKLCGLTGDDPVRVAVELQARRSANDEAAGLWRLVAQRLGSAKIAVLFAIVFAAMFLGGTDAYAEPAPLAARMNFAIIVSIFGLVLGVTRRLLASTFYALWPMPIRAPQS